MLASFIMELKLNPKLKCKLEFNGSSLKLSVGELTSIRELLPDSSNGVILPKSKLKRMFESGILATGENIYQTSAAQKIKFLSGKKLRKELYLNLDLPKNSYGMEPSVCFYWQPDVVEFVGQLYEIICESISSISEFSAALNEKFPKKRALRFLHRSVHNWLKQNQQYAEFISWSFSKDGKLSLNLRDPQKIFLELGTRILRLNLKYNKKKIEIFLPASDLPMICGFFDYMNGRKKVMSKLNLQNRSVEKLISAIRYMDGFTKLKPQVWRPKTIPNVTEFSITHMGHASLIVDSAKSRILIDPWLFPHQERFEKSPLTSAELGDIEAIFFTHHHLDHMETGSLLVLPHDVPVFVPKEGTNQLRPRNVKWLRQLGFTKVFEIAPYEEFKSQSGMIITAIPFFGEGSSRVGFDASCYLVSKNRKNVLLYADSSPDDEGRSLVSSGDMKKIINKYGRISAIWGSWWQQQGFSYRLGPHALLSGGVKTENWLDLTESCLCTPDHIEELLMESGANIYITYAESGPECFLPKEKMSNTIAAFLLLWKGVFGLQKKLQKRGCDIVEAAPYLTYCVPKKGEPYFLEGEVAPSRIRKASAKFQERELLPENYSASESNLSY